MWRTDAVLRPRALPADTSVRFLLVVAAVVAASLYLFDALWFVVRGETFLDAARACGVTVDPAAAGSVSDTSAALQAQADCRRSVSREQSAFAVAGTLLVLGAAYLGYRLLPTWQERRGRLVALDPGLAALRDEVERVCVVSGLPRAPTLRLDATDPRVHAHVFGTARQPRLAVAGGLVVAQVLDPDGFQAVLRHELAHVANRDVGWTYYTVTVWWSFLGLALAPVVAVLAFSDLRYVTRLGWRSAVLAMLVLMARNAVLRAREAFADATAAEWGAGAHLDRVLAAGDGARQRRPRLLRRHPTAAERRQLLASPDGLFRGDLFVGLAAGVAAGTTFESLEGIVALVLPMWVAMWVPALAVAPLLASIVCVAAWRAGLRSVARGREHPVAGRLTVGVGVGLAAAPVLGFDAAAGGLVAGMKGALGYAVWAVGSVLIVGLVARYAVDAGRVAVEAGLCRPAPWLALLPHALAVSGLLAAVLAFGHLTMVAFTWMGAGQTLRMWRLWAFLPTSLGPGDDGLHLLLVVSLACGALLAARAMLPRRPGAASRYPWAWRDAAVPSFPVPQRPSLRPVLAVGAVAGVVAVAGHVTARVAGAMLVDPQVWRSDGYRLALGFGTVGLIAATAVGGALAAAALAPRRWEALGIVGAAMALAVAASGVLAAAVAAGCGLLPRAAVTASCGPPTLGELRTFGLLPTGLAVIGVAGGVAVVAAVRAVPCRRRARLHGTPARRFVAATTLALVVPAGAAGVLVAAVLTTEVETVTGPGYEIAVPATWQAQEVPGSVPLLSTLDQTVRVTLAPVSTPAAPAGAERLQVGGVPAWYVGRESAGILELRGYDLRAPAGSYRLLVLGRAEVLEGAATGELTTLLAAVRWTPGGSS